MNTDEENVSHSLKKFLAFQSKSPLGTVYCPDCGSACSYLSAKFWLDGDEDVFSVSLPFCLQCYPQATSPMPAIN